MGEPRLAMIGLAQRLIAFEEASTSKSDSGANAAFRVLEKLQLLLTRFAGSDGFSALMRRAIALFGFKTLLWRILRLARTVLSHTLRIYLLKPVLHLRHNFSI